MRVELELTKEQLQLIIDSLEINFRFMMRQWSLAGDLLANYTMPLKRDITDEDWQRVFDRWLQRRDDAEKVFRAAGTILYGEGYGHELPPDCSRISDIWSAFRHLQWEALGRNDVWDVRSGEPLQMSDYPMIRLKLTNSNDDV